MKRFAILLIALCCISSLDSDAARKKAKHVDRKSVV